MISFRGMVSHNASMFSEQSQEDWVWSIYITCIDHIFFKVTTFFDKISISCFNGGIIIYFTGRLVLKKNPCFFCVGVCSDEGLTLETSAAHHIPQAKNIPYYLCQLYFTLDNLWLTEFNVKVKAEKAYSFSCRF